MDEFVVGADNRIASRNRTLLVASAVLNLSVALALFLTAALGPNPDGLSLAMLIGIMTLVFGAGFAVAAQIFWHRHERLALAVGPSRVRHVGWWGQPFETGVTSLSRVAVKREAQVSLWSLFGVIGHIFAALTPDVRRQFDPALNPMVSVKLKFSDRKGTKTLALRSFDQRQLVRLPDVLAAYGVQVKDPWAERRQRHLAKAERRRLRKQQRKGRR